MEVDIPPDTEAATIAEDFANAFADTASGDGEAWLAALREHCYESYCDLLDGVDLTEIPAEPPTGPATVEAGDDLTARTATVPADGGVWRVMLFASAHGGWLVTDCRWEPV